MKLAIFSLIVLAAYAALRMGEDYVRRSLRSFRRAEAVWADLSATADGLIQSDAPASVKRVVLALMMSAGCGCFVRGMLVSHYLPRVSLQQSLRERRSAKMWESAFSDVDSLPAGFKEDFSRLLALVMIYDSYRNPLQGFFFRRLLRSVLQPKLDYGTRAEVQLTAFSVVSKKEPRMLIPA